MKKFAASVAALAAVCAMVFAGCSSNVTGTTSGTGTSTPENSAVSQLSGTLTLNGSTSMTELVQALGEKFHDQNPNVQVEKSGTGSGEAVSAVTSGNALIGDLSRNLKDEENPDQFEVVQIATDGIAIAVNKENTVNALTSEQVSKIFSGEITNWKDVGGEDHAITVLGREASSGTRDGFESIFHVEEPRYAAELTSTGEVVTRVGSDKYAVGYVSLGSVSSDITACKIDGVEATEENVADGTYTASRPFIQIYKKGSDSDLIQAWFAFLNSGEGQKIVADAGFVPVTK